MPLFQVLKCFKCFVFQVHQTKKSNKWECKLCGAKQSIKRHYGLGTGKECRLHVQKLNSIRQVDDEINEVNKLNENSDEDIEKANLEEASVCTKNQANFKSKWTDFVHKTEDIEVPVPDLMYMGNAEVVLEIPAKRQKYSRSKATNNSPVSTTSSKTDCFDNNQGTLQMTNVEKKSALPKVSTTSKFNTNINEDHLITATSKQTGFLESKTQEIKTFLPHKVVKNSKWAQYADNSDEDSIFPICDDQGKGTGISIDDADLSKIGDHIEKSHKNQTKSIFSLCDDKDLDDVLDI